MNLQLLSALIGALVGGLITAMGWFANYYLSRKKEDESRRREAALKHLERQIEELYGPLWGLIQQSEAIYQVACKRLPTANGRVDLSQFKGQDGEIWNYLKETFFMPINLQVAELLRTKIYLIDANEIPASFQAFMSHQAQFAVLHRLWRERGIETPFLGTGGWPAQFNVDVAESLESLRKRYQAHLQQARRT